MNNIMVLRTNGSIKTSDDREFTRLVGGFGEDKPMFTVWQAGELLGLRTSDIMDNFNNNIDEFENAVDFVDLKSLNGGIVKTEHIEITSFLKSVGITHHKYGRTKQWLAFSFSGMMKLVKIATTKESWEIYDRFLEDYFQTKAENKVMKDTIENQIEEWKNQKALFMGLAVMERDEVKQIELLKQMENANENITKLEKSLAKEEVVKQLQPRLHFADTITDTDSCYDIGSFAKILGVKDLGRNNMFKWMRNKELLMKSNEPYQRHMKYFKVIPTENNGYINNKTLLRPNGIEYIVKKLIEDDVVITKTVEQIINELEGIC